ncbi:hypothetical protein FVF58_06250 [Paraburkholderia panacisoli]|uniref:Enolase C-terminal domain-containing protein n=1 Tax=Paraburkholderia panacisoli TaxID=2603818 RepID=A0A5B0HGI3_9BURK|nr:hypothetical protein FVF58_06250 [Paraburkholderia panacisoli]
MLGGEISAVNADSCRLGGLNEVLVVLLMAAKFGVPVCPHGVVSGCASTCSTSLCSTTSACRHRLKTMYSNTSTTCTSTLSTPS